MLLANGNARPDRRYSDSVNHTQIIAAMKTTILKRIQDWWTPQSQLTSPHTPASTQANEATYAAKIAQEQAIFATQINVHDLPSIFHYWSNKYLRQMQEPFGFSNPDQFFETCLARAFHAAAQRPARFVSIGAGNCDAEVRLAVALKQQGMSDFVLECIDINPHMLERGRALASEAGVALQVLPLQGDFNAWRPQQQFDAVIANQSLHHVLNLENLFDAIHAALAPGGTFITSDMIGRNGHQRWPEALAIVQEFWNELPKHYRYNVQLKRQEHKFQNWDCSQQGFEGIRAQDVLPLLIQRFDFEFFLGFANIIDPFIDRSFGHHFNANTEWDRDFIDRVHARDEAEMLAGSLKPTHMLAVMRKDYSGTTNYWKHLTPQFCARASNLEPVAAE